MKLFSKKTIAAMVAGTFMIAAAATTPFLVQAAEINSPSTGQHQMEQKCQQGRQMNPEKMAQRLSSTFDIDQATILEYNKQGKSFKDIGRAAFLANASGKSLADVMSLKTSDNSWKDVANTLGITKEQMKEARRSMAANRLNKKTGLDKTTALTLLHDGYRPRDIGMAAELEKNTNKPLTEILALKKINNTWFDVATTLDVDKETFKNDTKELGFGFRDKGHKEHRFYGEQNSNQ